MKVKAIEKSTEFKPVSIEITFETQKEVDDFGTLFNYVPFCQVTEALDINDEAIRFACKTLGGEISPSRNAWKDSIEDWFRFK